MPYQPPQWKIELLASRFPQEDWVMLRREDGRPYKFVERKDADAELKKLKKSQPHATIRVAPA